jgi:hypothetical protein
MAKSLLAAFLMALSAGPAASAEEQRAPAAMHRLVIITAKGEPIDNLSLDDLRRLYLARIHRLGGHRLVPVILRNTEPAQRFFLREVAAMADIDFTQLWIAAVFRGEVSAPPRLAQSPADACLFVAGHQHAIAFVEPKDAECDVKKISVNGKPYDAPDYALQWTSP